jgi:hypothetical protein
MGGIEEPMQVPNYDTRRHVYQSSHTDSTQSPPTIHYVRRLR